MLDRLAALPPNVRKTIWHHVLDRLLPPPPARNFHGYATLDKDANTVAYHAEAKRVVVVHDTGLNLFLRLPLTKHRPLFREFVLAALQDDLWARDLVFLFRRPAAIGRFVHLMTTYCSGESMPPFKIALGLFAQNDHKGPRGWAWPQRFEPYRRLSQVEEVKSLYHGYYQVFILRQLPRYRHRPSPVFIPSSSRCLS